MGAELGTSTGSHTHSLLMYKIEPNWVRNFNRGREVVGWSTKLFDGERYLIFFL